jgi:hypothetical protein
MAIREEIIIDVIDNGLEQTTKKAIALGRATKAVGDTTKEMAGHMRGSANSVLENGGAMGLLNDATGGIAMTIKDAVEATVLFTKSQRLASIQQAIYSTVVGASTGAMKIFKIALVATGVGALVVGLGLLIANFDKVKKAVLNVIPGLASVGEFIGDLIDSVTDFIGVTSDATRELERLTEQADKSLEKNKKFIQQYGDTIDEFTKKKIESVNAYNEAIKDENQTEQDRINLKKRLDRDLLKADEDRDLQRDKKRKDAQDKIDSANKTARDKAKADSDKLAEAERNRIESILKILEDFKKREQDLDDKTELEKISREEQRAIEELERLKATEQQKEDVRAFYAERRKEEEARIDEEKAQLALDKQEAERNLILDQKEWEIENEVDPFTKFEKEKELAEEQAEFDLEKLQRVIDNAQSTAQEKTNAEIGYAARKQELDQQLIDLDKKNAEDKKIRDKAVADNALNVASQTLSLIGGLAKEGSALAKGIAVAQATMDTYKAAVGAYAAGVSVGGPAGLVLGPVMAGLAVVSGLANIKKILATKPVETGAPSGGASVSAPPPAPNFNLVQGTGSNQIAESIGGQNKPIQAFVVSSNVTTAQGMDRNIVENSKL